MDTIVYVDGFNLYYGSLRRRTDTRWLDLSALCQRLLPKNNIIEINYFTAKVKARPRNPDQPKRQELYLAALRTIPNLKIYKGAYIDTTKKRPLVTPQAGQTPAWPASAFFHDSEEKGSDVNLGSRLLVDAFDGRYQAAVVISNDGDLKMPVQIVRAKFGLHVTIVNPHPAKRRSAALSPQPLPANAAYIQLRQNHVKSAQFAATLRTKSGRKITKPPAW